MRLTDQPFYRSKLLRSFLSTFSLQLRKQEKGHILYMWNAVGVFSTAQHKLYSLSFVVYYIALKTVFSIYSTYNGNVWLDFEDLQTQKNRSDPCALWQKKREEEIISCFPLCRKTWVSNMLSTHGTEVHQTPHWQSHKWMIYQYIFFFLLCSTPVSCVDSPIRIKEEEAKAETARRKWASLISGQILVVILKKLSNYILSTPFVI